MKIGHLAVAANRGDTLITWSEDQAARLLAPLGARWSHVQGVSALARIVSQLFDDGADASHLIAAAYVHDIGYAPALAHSGFHPIDGARFLRSAGAERLACLVAHHSEACVEARLRGLEADLAAFARERSAVADALTFCDQLIGPMGQAMSLRERRADILARYTEDDIVARAYRKAFPALALAVGRTWWRLARRGMESEIASAVACR